jgi:hypothetical protein
LIPGVFLLTTFFAFWEAGGVVIALQLPTQVLVDSALGPFEDAPTVSALVRLGQDRNGRNGDFSLDARHRRNEVVQGLSSTI